MAYNRHGALTANVITTIVINRTIGAVEIMNVNGLGPIFFTVNGQDPAIDGDDCELVPAGAGAALEVDAPQRPVTVKMISNAATTFCVRAE